MSFKLLTEHHLEFLSLKGGCTGSSESTLVIILNVGNHVSLLICYYIMLQMVILIMALIGLIKSKVCLKI